MKRKLTSLSWNSSPSDAVDPRCVMQDFAPLNLHTFPVISLQREREVWSQGSGFRDEGLIFEGASIYGLRGFEFRVSGLGFEGVGFRVIG